MDWLLSLATCPWELHLVALGLSFHVFKKYKCDFLFYKITSYSFTIRPPTCSGHLSTSHKGKGLFAYKLKDNQEMQIKALTVWMVCEDTILREVPR